MIAEIKIETVKVKMTFLEPLLGSSPSNPSILTEFVIDKTVPDAVKREEAKVLEDRVKSGAVTADAAKEEATETAEEKIEKQTTVFPKDDTGLFLWNYVFKGALKEWCDSARDLNVKIKGVEVPYRFKGAVDKYVLVAPRRIYLRDASGKIIPKATALFERTMRVETMQGPRTCLARSEQLPPGTNLEVTFLLHLPETKPGRKTTAFLNREWLEWLFSWGSEHGFLQWRSGEYGKFNYEIIEPKE